MKQILQSFKIFILSLSLFVSCSSETNNPDVQISSSKFDNVGLFTQDPPEKKLSWKSSPHVRICEFSPASETRVNEAIEWWKKRGYMFSGVTQGGLWGGCKKGKMSGTITISLSGRGFNFSKNHLGETKIYHTSSGTILQSNIELSIVAANKPRVLEHEIGHALGWGHYKKCNHIMHPTYSMGGYDDNYIVKNVE